MRDAKLQVKYRALAELKKLPNNPRTIKKADMERLKKSIKDNLDYFEARPVILSDRTGELVIIAGNQRYEAAKALKMAEIPTVLLEGLTEEREREIIIRDNVANGEWDFDILANEWNIEDLEDWGVDYEVAVSSIGGSIREDDETLFMKWGKRTSTRLAISEKEKDELDKVFGDFLNSQREVIISSEEDNSLYELYRNYIKENGVSIGFVDELVRRWNNAK